MPTYHYHELAQRNPPGAARTYKLSWDIIRRFDAQCERHQVGVSDLARFLLDYALTEVEAGRLDIRTKPAALRQIDNG